ncbi:MAG: haloacid dehalogenase-like hydrolase [Promethearchaeota archaeon]
MAQTERKRLIVFDVDGVILRGFWLSQITARLGITKSFALGVLIILYEARIMEVTSLMRYAYRLLRGVPREWLLRMTNQSDLVRGAQETIQFLRKQGHIIVLISSGIPDFVVSRLAKIVGAQFAYGLHLKTKGTLLTGHISVLGSRGQTKVDFVKQLITIQQLGDYELVAVANDRNNIPLLKYSHLPVGFRPDRVARRYVQYVVTTPDLRALLPFIASPSVSVYIPRRLGQELLRQLLHASAVLIPFLWLSDSSWHLPILTVIASGSLLFFFSELFRSYGIRIPLISKVVRAAGRETEIGSFVLSPLYFAVGVAFPLVLFSILLPFTLIAASCVIAFLVGDAFSTIAGLLFGRHKWRINPQKTIEGTLTGFSLAFLVLLFFLSPISALLCAFLAGVIELLPIPYLDDNLSVSLGTTIVFVILQLSGFYIFL